MIEIYGYALWIIVAAVTAICCGFIYYLVRPKQKTPEPQLKVNQRPVRPMYFNVGRIKMAHKGSDE